MSLPAATPRPCSDCPWRRDAAKGWLGPLDAEEWIELAHGEAPIACHQTIKQTDDDGIGDWANPEMRQCRGAAIFRENVCKSPRDPEVARGPRDTEAVFARNHEFLAHHQGEFADFLKEQRHA